MILIFCYVNVCMGFLRLKIWLRSNIVQDHLVGLSLLNNIYRRRDIQIYELIVMFAVCKKINIAQILKLFKWFSFDYVWLCIKKMYLNFRVLNMGLYFILLIVFLFFFYYNWTSLSQCSKNPQQIKKKTH